MAAKKAKKKAPKKRNGDGMYVRYHVFLENAYGVRSSGKWAVTIGEARSLAQGLTDLYGQIGVMIEKVEISNGGRDEKVIQRTWYSKPKKRNGKTVIKAKRVTILNLKKNPAFEIHKTLKATKRGNQAGWLLGTKFYAKSRGQKALPGGSVLDLNSGLVYSRVENPKRRKNIQMMAGGHPIRASVDYDPALAGESPSRKSKAAQSRTRKAKQKSIKAAGGVKKYIRKIKTRKAATRKAGQSKRMTAATKQRKATTTRLASRLLDRSGPKAKRRNPNTDTKAAYESFQGKPSTKSTSLNFPNGTPANVYKLGTLHSITLQSGAVVKPAGKTVWLCADTKGKLHLGTSGERLVNAPKGALGKVREVEYITTKPHLGDNKPTRYYHELGEETGQKPTLYSDGAGGLVFKGGATYVTREGIRN